MRRLARRLPTVFHSHKSEALLFDDNGVWKLSALEIGYPYRPLYVESDAWSRRIWALVYLGPEEPAGIFRSPPFFVVNTVSPSSNQVEWLKKLSTEYFCMVRWSDSEVLQVYVNITSHGSQHSCSLQSSVPRKKAHRTSDLVPSQGVLRVPQRYISLREQAIGVRVPPPRRSSESGRRPLATRLLGSCVISSLPLFDPVRGIARRSGRRSPLAVYLRSSGSSMLKTSKTKQLFLLSDPQ